MNDLPGKERLSGRATTKPHVVALVVAAVNVAVVSRWPRSVRSAGTRQDLGGYGSHVTVTLTKSHRCVSAKVTDPDAK